MFKSIVSCAAFFFFLSVVGASESGWIIIEFPQEMHPEYHYFIKFKYTYAETVLEGLENGEIPEEILEVMISYQVVADESGTMTFFNKSQVDFKLYLEILRGKMCLYLCLYVEPEVVLELNIDYIKKTVEEYKKAAKENKERVEKLKQVAEKIEEILNAFYISAPLQFIC